MQWSRIQVEMPDSSAQIDASLGVVESGLDATAEQMHDKFMGSIPHLEEVRNEHWAVVSDLSNSVEASKMMSRDFQPIGEMLSEFGGSMGDREISIPLPSTVPDQLVIETGTEGSENLVRLIAPERFGGSIKQFSLNDGDSIAAARWSDGSLVLELN
tara:strand:+ start:28403 stop:28873 length:471 start_codon:yes stop_codon:yes gene_type:complete